MVDGEGATTLTPGETELHCGGRVMMDVLLKADFLDKHKAILDFALNRLTLGTQTTLSPGAIPGAYCCNWNPRLVGSHCQQSSRWSMHDGVCMATTTVALRYSQATPIHTHYQPSVARICDLKFDISLLHWADSVCSDSTVISHK